MSYWQNYFVCSFDIGDKLVYNHFIILEGRKIVKIFKHRGDIYISKSGYKSSREERILLSLLAVIVVLTLIFLAIMGHKYSSFAEFIAGDDITIEQTEVYNEVNLPDISGRTNFLVFETDDEQSVIHYAYLVQMDCDTMSYKACTLDPKLTIDGDSLYDIYLSGGGALLQSRLTSVLGTNIDYYFGFENSDMVEFINSLGTIIYPMNESIKFNSGADDDSYSIRISDGEQRLGGNDISNLLRYYSNENMNISTSNEILLYALTQLFNADNFEKCDQLFRQMVTNSSTNITVRDFENGKDSIMVFCYKNSDITIYSCSPDYAKHQLSSNDLQDIKGYFN